MIVWIRTRAADGKVISPLVTSIGSFRVLAPMSNPAYVENPDWLFPQTVCLLATTHKKKRLWAWRECNRRDGSIVGTRRSEKGRRGI